MEDKPRRYARDCVLISIIFRPPKTRVTDNRVKKIPILLAQPPTGGAGLPLSRWAKRGNRPRFAPPR